MLDFCVYHCEGVMESHVKKLQLKDVQEMRGLCITFMIMTVFVTVAEPVDVDFKSASDARAYFKPQGRAPYEWDGMSSITRSSSSVTNFPYCDSS